MDEKVLNDKLSPQSRPSGDGETHPYADPKVSGEVGELRTRPVAIRPQQRLLHDPAVTFEEYLFYAARTRAEEAAGAARQGPTKFSPKSIFIPSTGSAAVGPAGGGGGSSSSSGAWDAVAELNLSDPVVRAGVSDEEWTNASRALRTATAAACFYLITTDILGPFVSDGWVQHVLRWWAFLLI